MIRSRAWMSWSSGKDSTLAGHGVRRVLVEAQAAGPGQSRPWRRCLPLTNPACQGDPRDGEMLASRYD